MNIGCNIRKIRELKNIKQDYIAHKLNLSLTSYGKIERNEVDINLSRVHQIADVLDVSINLLIGFDAGALLSSSKRDYYVYEQVIKSQQEQISQLSVENSKLIQIIETITSTERHYTRSIVDRNSNYSKLP